MFRSVRPAAVVFTSLADDFEFLLKLELDLVGIVSCIGTLEIRGYKVMEFIAEFACIMHFFSEPRWFFEKSSEYCNYILELKGIATSSANFTHN